MTITSIIRTGYGINLHEQNIWPHNTEALRKLIGYCSDPFKEAFWENFEDDVFAEGWEVAEILENLNADSPLMALATIMQDVILNTEHIALIVAVDFADSDNVILAMPDDDLTREAPLYSRISVCSALKHFTRLISPSVACDPGYISWHEKAPPQRDLVVETPIGKIVVRAKGESSYDTEYVGVFVNFVSKETGEERPLSCIEYDPGLLTIATDTFYDESYTDRHYHNDLPGATLAYAKHLITRFLKNEYLDDVDEDFDDLQHIALAWGCADEHEQVEINVYADLENFRMKTYLTAVGHPAVLVSTNNYSSLEDMIHNGLDSLHYDSMCEILHDEWLEFSKDSGTQQWLEQQFPAGSCRDFECFNTSVSGTVKGLSKEGWIIVEQVTGEVVHLLYCGELFAVMEEVNNHGK